MFEILGLLHIDIVNSHMSLSGETQAPKITTISVTNLVGWAGFGFRSKKMYMNNVLSKKDTTESEVSVIRFRENMARLRDLQHCVCEKDILEYLSGKFIPVPNVPQKYRSNTIPCVFKIVGAEDDGKDLESAVRVSNKEDVISSVRKGITCFASEGIYKHILEDITKPFSKSPVSIRWPSKEAKEEYILEALRSESSIKQLIIDNYSNQWLPTELGKIQEQYQLCPWGYQREFHRFLNDKYLVVGRVDKIEIRDGEMWIVEVKNRVKRFPETLHNWEIAQCQIYMWLSDVNHCCLEEHLFDQVRTHIIKRDVSLTQAIISMFLRNIEASKEQK